MTVFDRTPAGRSLRARLAIGDALEPQRPHLLQAKPRTATDPIWFLARVAPNQERAAQAWLAERDVAALAVQCVRWVRHPKTKEKMKQERPALPGYLPVHMPVERIGPVFWDITLPTKLGLRLDMHTDRFVRVAQRDIDRLIDMDFRGEFDDTRETMRAGPAPEELAEGDVATSAALHGVTFTVTSVTMVEGDPVAVFGVFENGLPVKCEDPWFLRKV